MIMLSATNYTLWKPRWRISYFARICMTHWRIRKTNLQRWRIRNGRRWKKKRLGRSNSGLDMRCSIFYHIAHEISDYKLWIKLEEMYQAKISWNKALLMRKLVNLKFQRGTTVAEHTSEFQNLVNQLVNQLEIGKEVKVEVEVTEGVLAEDDRGHNRDVALLCAFITTRKCISRGIVQSISRDEWSVFRDNMRNNSSDSSGWEWCSPSNISRWKVKLNIGFRKYLPIMQRHGDVLYICSMRMTCTDGKHQVNRVVDKWAVQFCMAGERSLTLTEVRHVLSLPKNLIFRC